ncbi:MAG: hypothetical protein IK145_02790 [Bacteroidales bacterium]|nr:hypothetical protein [Bacteroidales bacterium]
MKRLILFAVMGLLAIAPAGAQSKKVVRQAKEDAKFQLQALKEKGFKALDNVKLDDAVNKFLVTKYDDKSIVEFVGKATAADINEAKAQARLNAVGNANEGDIVDQFFVYRKSRKNFDVVCYSLLRGEGVNVARATGSNVAASEGTAATIAAAQAEKVRKEAKAAADKARKSALKAEKKAKKDVKKAEEKVKKAQEKAKQKTDEALQKIQEAEQLNVN